LKTRTSDNWDCHPGKFDVLNLRMTFESSSDFGFPDLQPTEFVPSCLAAWNMPRHRAHAADSGGALHFFLDDYRFETAWSAPERLLPRVAEVGAALTPDFSVWRDIPQAAQVWNTYRSRWCGAFWQACGVEVIPTVGWGAPDTFDFCFDGIPSDSVVAISDVGMKNSELDKALFREGLRELIRRTSPRLLLSYGRLRYCDSLDLPEVREYPTYWDRRRKQISEWENEAEHLEPEAAEQPLMSLQPRKRQVCSPQEVKPLYSPTGPRKVPLPLRPEVQEEAAVAVEAADLSLQLGLALEV
jgi:hypothetical protein